jgi:membrane protease YdiL (CAAX protease family)
MPAFSRDLPRGQLIALLPVGIVVFAAQNAVFEEVIWRGAVMQSLESAFGRGAFVCVLQAAGFGVWHFRGFPSGVIGSALAGIFALMMGILRMRGRGMLAPFVAHLCADTTIYVMVAIMALGG